MTIRNKPIPEPLLKSPSPLINELTDYINHTSIEYVHQFSLISAITFLSHAYGRQYKSEWNTPINLYSLLVGQSGVGKNYCRMALDEFQELHTNIIGDATSGTGLFTALVRNPNSFMISDEIGGKMNSKDPNIKSLWLFIRDLFNIKVANEGAYANRVNGKIEEKKENYSIFNPSLSILGMTTPGLLTGNLSDDDIESGSLNRFCIVNAFPNEIIRNRTGMISNPSPELFGKILTSGSNLQNRFSDKAYSLRPELKIIKFSSGDADMLLDFRHELRNEKNSSYTVRLVETAIRIAIITTISMGLNVIPVSVLEWAIEYVKYWLYNVKKISETASASEQSNDVQKILDFIFSKAEKGIQRHEINKFCRSKTTYYIDDVRRDRLLGGLVDDKFLEIAKGPKNIKNGSSKTHYFYIGDKRK